MYSLNVPLPPAVRSLASALRSALAGFERVRRHHTLVVKRLPAADRRELLDDERRAREALRRGGAPAFELRVADVGVFEEPAAGPGPLVYLAVESPGLRRVHALLVEEFGAVEDVEGDDYRPHVTLARGGGDRAVRRVREREFDPVEWTATELEFYDADRHERVDAVSLPA